jgi:peroxiredoxin (alkyl hydroperoxide reductase subunit C)
MQVLSVPDVGQVAPDFRLRGPDGTSYSLSEYRGEKHVLVVFYPLAFSPVCSHQLPEIQARIGEIDAADVQVLGVSVDSHWANRAFAQKLGVSFPLLSDWKHEASVAYGVFLPDAGYSNRASFLVDKQGRILWREVSENRGNVDAIPSVDAALKSIPGS